MLALCLAGFVFATWLGGREKPSWAARLSRFSGALQLGALVAAYLVVRPGAGDDGLQAIAAAQAKERPIFVDIYSNF